MKRNDPLLAETLRYLGIREKDPDEALAKKAGACLAVLEKAVRPRCVQRTFPVSAEEDAATGRYTVTVGNDWVIESRDLFRNLEGCRFVVLVACTLGEEADRIIRRSQVLSMADTAFYQAACTALIEAYTDSVNEKIEAEAKARGFVTRPRYSPGYGDCVLETQRDFFDRLGVTKAIGITLTEGMLMVPEKSVTAFIGLRPEEEARPKADPGGARPEADTAGARPEADPGGARPEAEEQKAAGSFESGDIDDDNT